MSGFFREYLDLVTIPQLAICDTKSAARLCSNVLFNRRYFPYFVQIILAGFDAQREGQIYEIDLFG